MSCAISGSLRAAMARGMVAAICVGSPAARTLAGANDSARPPAVNVGEDDASFVLGNGIVTARVSKRSGDLASLESKGLETLASNSGHPGGYWSHDAVGGAGGVKTAITIDPKTIDGERGEVSVKGTLRLAICATGARQIDVVVNDKPVGQTDRLIGDGAITRHSIQGIWYERELAFDAALLKQGTNVLQLIFPAGPINNGMIYDYVRLELDQDKPPPGSSAGATPSAR